MDNTDTYRTIRTVSEGTYKDKGSRFIARAIPVTDEQEIKKHLDDVRKIYHDARHHCYAYLLGRGGETWRANDDGEPSGTAGRPILGQIKSAGLTNILIIVTRYFGGTLLGASGLIKAYKAASAAAIENAEIIDHIVNVHYEILFPYSAMNEIMKIIKEESIEQTEHSFELNCSMRINFREALKNRIELKFSRIEGVKMSFIYEE
jgi:uncharacterized YigZ family protein